MVMSNPTDNIAKHGAQRAADERLPRGIIFAMAAACGAAVANIYYNQPMLGLIETELGRGLATFVPTATQLGYAIGLFLLVPLGDLFERRRIIVIQFAILALSLAGVALAPNAALLLALSFVVGAGATVAQQIVPLAAHLAAPERRGAVVGTVMAGLLCGILLSRTLSGFVGAHYGWREMYWLAVPVALLAGVAMWRILPTSRPEGSLTYGALIGSLGGIWRRFPTLRRAAITQGLIFAAFSAFWTILALHLYEPPLHMGAEIAGLFGILGTVGILAAPLAGRIADRKGPRPVIVGGTMLALVSWLVFGVWSAIGGLIVGTILLDFASQSALVSHQHVIFALEQEARSRINTIFVGSMFLGGSAGSALATWAWVSGGWSAVCMLGASLALAAAVIAVIPARKNQSV